jgi:hypothetical protein
VSLPPAVPAYAPDIEGAESALGRAHLYITQLSDLLTARAVEANALHDELVAARERIAALEADLASRTTQTTEGVG